MKKLLLTLILFGFTCINVPASEITEDYLDMATSYCVSGNYREAINYLDKILIIEPTNKNVQDLRNGLRQLVQGNKSSFIIPKSNGIRQAINAKKQGNKDGELNALMSSDDYWANYFLGQYYKNTKDYNKAISYFVKSVNAKPNFVQCYMEIALCYFELRNYSQAITYLNQYLKVNPKDDFAYALRARANANAGNNDAALNDIITANSIENSNDYKFIEGKILYKIGNYSQAINKLTPLTEEIQNSEIYKYIGLSYAGLGNNADAIINLEKSIILSNDDKFVNNRYNELKMRIEK